MKRNILNIVVVFFFLFITSFSYQKYPGKLLYGFFYHDNIVEDVSDKRNYIEKNNGEKIYGEVIKLDVGLFKQTKVRIDSQEFLMYEIIGFRESDRYFLRYNNYFVRRIVHGKINIYEFDSSERVPNSDGVNFLMTGTLYNYFSQVGDHSNLKKIRRYSKYKKIVVGCQTSSDLANKKRMELAKETEKNQKFFNRIIEIYNNGCKE